MAPSTKKLLDFTFNFGKYDGLDKKADSNDVLPKLNALINIIHMRPGTLQDTPNCGVNLDGLLFAEGTELYDRRVKAQNDVYAQSELYVEPGFLENVSFTVQKNEGATDGSQLITMDITLASSVGVRVMSVNTPTGLIFKGIEFDQTPFE